MSDSVCEEEVFSFDKSLRHRGLHIILQTTPRDYELVTLEINNDEGIIVAERYLLRDVLGHGATGAVYLAEDLQLDRDVAIKVIDEKLVGNKDICSRFEREIYLTARLQHPGIVAVFERAEVDELPCYVMSTAVGETMEDYLERLESEEDPWTKFTLIERLNMFMRLLDIVAYAHNKRVLHRDLKPANIILGNYGEMYLLDWGLARQILGDNETEKFAHFDEMFGDTDPGTVSSHQYEAIDLKHAPTLVGGQIDNPDSEDYFPESDSIRRTTSGVRGITDTDEDETDSSEEETRQLVKGGTDITDDASASVPQAHTDISRSSIGLGSGARGLTTSGKPNSGMTKTGRTTNSSTRRVRTSDQYRSRRVTKEDSSRNEGRATRIGEVLGSPAYMAPEQARGQASLADERADVYSLGAILVEILTLRTPFEQKEGESLLSFIERIRTNKDRRSLKDLWPDAPAQLQRVSEWALRPEVEDRCPSVAKLQEEVQELLDQLAASFSEMERIRLQREREGAWVPVGRWNFLTQRTVEPFNNLVSAYDGDPVGQVLHPEMGGMLLGGYGLQVYPLSVPIGNDVRLTVELTITGGSECMIFMRGVPPMESYVFHIGAWNGSWLSITQVETEEELFNPNLLTMCPIGEDGETVSFKHGEARRHELTIEVEGSRLILYFDGERKLSVQDPCPLMGPEHQQMAIGTSDSQVVVHEVRVEQRRSALMVPSYAVANELLRQQLYPQAITYYQRFINEHPDSDLLVEARFMLCLAFEEAGYLQQADQELHDLLIDNLDHQLAQDAIFEMARIRVGESSNIGQGARVVLSYQEADDQSRSRFCIWAIQRLREAIAEDGIDADVEESLQVLKHLIRGFSDEDLLLETASSLLRETMLVFAHKLLDLQAFDELMRFMQRVNVCVRIGFNVELPMIYTPSDYIETSRRIGEHDLNDPVDRGVIFEMLDGFSTVRDIIWLASLGATPTLLEFLASREEELRPSLRLLQAALYARHGNEEKSHESLQSCFTLMDKIESERTDVEIASVSRLSMFALGFLDWDVAWEPLLVLNRAPELQALGAWLAECIGQKEAAFMAYNYLYSSIGSGFRAVAEQGMARLGMQDDDDE